MFKKIKQCFCNHKWSFESISTNNYKFIKFCPKCGLYEYHYLVQGMLTKNPDELITTLENRKTYIGRFMDMLDSINIKLYPY